LGPHAGTRAKHPYNQGGFPGRSLRLFMRKSVRIFPIIERYPEMASNDRAASFILSTNK
jgi:hypothetical protein